MGKLATCPGGRRPDSAQGARTKGHGRLVDKFFKIYAIIAVARQLSYKTGNLSGLDPLRGLPQKPFLTVGAKVAA
jgi:hypothetical protein